MTNRESEAGQW